MTSSQAGATSGADLERLQSHSQMFGDSACVPVLYLHIKFLTQKTALSGCPLCCNNRGILCSVGCSPVIPPSTCFLSLAAPFLLCPLPRPSAGLSASHTPELSDFISVRKVWFEHLFTRSFFLHPHYPASSLFFFSFSFVAVIFIVLIWL